MMLQCWYNINILWKYKIMFMAMGRPIYPFSWAGKRCRLCNVGGILLSWHQHWEVRCIWWWHCFFAKFLHWSGFTRTIGHIFRWRIRRTWPEQMFKDGHDKKHRYQDSCGNKAKRNGIHRCSKFFHGASWFTAVWDGLGSELVYMFQGFDLSEPKSLIVELCWIFCFFFFFSFWRETSRQGRQIRKQIVETCLKHAQS